MLLVSSRPQVPGMYSLCGPEAPSEAGYQMKTISSRLRRLSFQSAKLRPTGCGPRGAGRAMARSSRRYCTPMQTTIAKTAAIAAITIATAVTASKRRGFLTIEIFGQRKNCTGRAGEVWHSCFHQSLAKMESQASAPRDVFPPTPPGPEGSNGNGLFRVQWSAGA